MHAHPDSFPVDFDEDGVQMRHAEWGGMHVAQYTLAPGTDLAPFFASLPRSLCEGNHWGMVLHGALHLRYADGSQEVTRAGELYYWPAGHTAWTDEGVTFFAITPSAEEHAMQEQLAEAGP